MSEHTEEKKSLRAVFRERRRLLADRAAGHAIAESFLAAFGGYGSYFIYLSVGTEVPTAELIARLNEEGKDVCVPRVEGTKMCSVRLGGELIPGPFPQPAAGEEHTCEVAVVPLLAADEAGNRLGQGGGCYDRYFALHPSVLRVGIAYEGQVLPALPAAPHDIPLHALVTECGIRRFNA